MTNTDTDTSIIRNIGYSYLSFGLTELFTYPLSTIKNNYIQNPQQGIIAHTKNLFKTGGFYNGVSVIYLRYGIGISFKYAAYMKSQEYYDKTNFYYNVASSLLICNLAALVEHPLDVIATKKSVKSSDLTNMRNLYNGFSANVPRVILGSSVLPLYQACYAKFNDYLSNQVNIVASSVVVATGLTIVTHPFEFFKIQKILFSKYNLRANLVNTYLGSSVSLMHNNVSLILFMTILDNLERIRTFFMKL